jgi:hypothetical protein
MQPALGVLFDVSPAGGQNRQYGVPREAEKLLAGSLSC